MVAHGWADDPSQGWINWLAEQLHTEGVSAAAPQFPDAKRPDPAVWLRVLAEAVGRPDQDLVLVGHSLGCLIALKYLSELGSQIAGVVLVAGMKDTMGWQPEGLYPIDFDKAKSNALKRICIYSDDDDRVEPARTKELAKLIGAELVLDAGKGHFAGLYGVSELPSVLAAVESCFTN